MYEAGNFLARHGTAHEQHAVARAQFKVLISERSHTSVIGKTVTGARAREKNVSIFVDDCFLFSIHSRLISITLIGIQAGFMYRWHTRAQEDILLLRLLVKTFEETAHRATHPASHAEILQGFRNQLADLELREAQVFWRFRFSTVQRLVSSVFSRVRAIG
jgi:hypothetical protein